MIHHNTKMTNVIKPVIAWLILLTMTGSLEAQEPVDNVRNIEVKIRLLDIEQINNVSQSFVANLILVLRWHDPELAHDGQDSISKSLNDVWHPRIQILNQQRLVETFPRTVEILPDGEVIYRQRVWGGFSQPLELRKFPFDTQRLKFTVVDVSSGSRDVVLNASPRAGISESLTIPDWSVRQWKFETENLQFDNESTPRSGVVFSVDVERDTNYFIFKAIMPLVLIVMMSWLVYWIDPSLVASQISVAVTAMLTMIAYRFALAGMIPRLPFLTNLDHFVLASTLMVFLSMIEVVYTAHLSTHDQLEKARMIDRRARWIAPPAYVVMLIIIVIRS
jgi:hypothetical protein